MIGKYAPDSVIGMIGGGGGAVAGRHRQMGGVEIVAMKDAGATPLL